MAEQRTHIMTGDSYEAFVIELRGKPGGAQYLSLDNALDIVWVDNADDAIHFSRRSDAERMVDNADELDIAICDHCWPGGVARDRVVRDHDWHGEWRK